MKVVLHRHFALGAPLFQEGHKRRGLGLGIAKKIVEAHGGEISFRPNRDKGVSFTVKLPTNAIDSHHQDITP